MISTCSRGFFRFSSNAIAAKTYAKFQEKYAAHIDAFNKKTSQHEKVSAAIKRSTQKAFKHPYDDLHHKPYYSPILAIQSLVEFMGAEQVSSHFENLGRARRDLIVFWTAFFVIKVISAIPDFHFYAKTLAPAWIFMYFYMYYYLEGKYYMSLPILLIFYRRIINLQMNNLHTYYAENIEVRIRNLMATAKSQIDFKTIHNDYLSVRNNTILTFLINEQTLLKNHLYERAQNILKQAEALQNMNQTRIINDVLDQTLKSVDKAYAENKAQIESQIFKLALEGIANGKMDYAKDPILPHVVKTIQNTVNKFSAISPEQQRKLVVLTKEQLTSIRATDARLRDQFLQNQPKIDGSLKNHESVSKILSKWGK